MSGNDSNNEFPPGEGGAAADGGGDTPLNTGRPAVAAAPGKLIFVLLFAGIFIFIIVRSVFFGEKPAEKVVTHHKESVTQESARSQNELSISPGSLPQAPTPEMTSSIAAAPPPPPPPPPALLPPPTVDIRGGGGQTDEQYVRRLHSPLITVGGAAPKSSAALEAAKRRAAIADSNDPNSAFAQSVSETHAQKAYAGKIENLSVTIAQGKLIHAVLETAIDSALPGPVRGIVSHDVYAEAGREILIPKGSRLIGNYNTQIKRGQARVFVIWSRVIRPDGIDMFIDSPVVDSLGRAGLPGDVDNKYFELFSAAIMTSSLDIGVAAIGDALFGNQQTTTTNNGTGSTTTQSPTSAAMQQAVQNIGQVGQNIVGSFLNTSPEIYIDQGTPMEVFVNRDLIFPPELTQSSRYIE